MVAKIQIQMDRFLTQIEKFLSSTFIIAAEIRSDPPFIAEVLVAAFVFIIYILFLIDINKMIQRAHADQTDLLHNKHKNFVCSMGDGPIQDYYYNEMQIVEDYSSHIERLLSITPSDYIRQYKHKQRREDKKSRERRLATFSLLPQLEKEFNNESMRHLLNALRRNVDAIKRKRINEFSCDRISFILPPPILSPLSDYDEMKISFTTNDCYFLNCVKKERDNKNEELLSIEDYFADNKDDAFNWPNFL